MLAYLLVHIKLFFVLLSRLFDLILNKDFNQNHNFKILFSEVYKIFKFNKNLGKFEKIDIKNFINLNLLAGDGKLLLLR